MNKLGIWLTVQTDSHTDTQTDNHTDRRKMISHHSAA